MTFTEEEFPELAFAIHRRYLYWEWASEAIDAATSQPGRNDSEIKEHLMEWNRESNLLSMFQYRMATDPGFQQHVLSLLLNDKTAFKRTVRYLTHLRDEITFDKKFCLYGTKSEESPSPENGLDTKNVGLYKDYALFRNDGQNPIKVLDIIYTPTSSEESRIMRLLKTTACLNPYVEWNNVALFASRKFQDPYWYQHLNLDWQKYFHESGFRENGGKNSYKELDTGFGDITRQSIETVTGKTCRVTIKISDSQSIAVDNLYYGMPILFPIRDDARKVFLPWIPPFSLQEIYASTTDTERFRKFTNDFLTIESELWFNGLKESGKHKLLCGEYEYSIQNLIDEKPDSNLLMSIAEKIFQKKYEGKENRDAVWEIYRTLAGRNEIEQDDFSKITEKLQYLEDSTKTWSLPLHGDVKISLHKKGEEEPKFSEKHPKGCENNYAMVYNNPYIISPEKRDDLKKAEEDILSKSSALSSLSWKDSNTVFKKMEDEIMEKYRPRFDLTPTLYLVSKMYLKYPWLEQARVWFSKTLQKHVKEDIIDNEACILNQLKCDYWLKRGNPNSLRTMEEAKKRLPAEVNEDVKWEFLVRYAKAYLQNLYFENVEQCYRELCELDPENTYYQKEADLISKFLRDIIRVTKGHLSKLSKKSLNHFNTADTEALLLISENAEDNNMSMIDYSRPLIYYAWGLDSFLADSVWPGVYDYVMSKCGNKTDALNGLNRWKYIFEKNQTPSLGNWANLYETEITQNQKNVVMESMQKFLKEKFRDETLQAISDASKCLVDYRNDICHAKPVYLTHDKFVEKRTEISQKVNKVLELVSHDLNALRT